MVDEIQERQVKFRLAKYSENLTPVRERELCQPPFHHIDETCFYFSDEMRSMKEAKEKCQELDSNLFGPR